IFGENSNAAPFLQFGNAPGGVVGADWTLNSADTLFQFRPGTIGTGSVMNLDNNGNLAIEGSLSDLSNTTLSIADSLDVRGNAGTTAIASLSGKSSFAGLLVDNSGAGDLFTASSAGLTRFVIKQNGNVGIGTSLP